jgi:hypothetical protein
MNRSEELKLRWKKEVEAEENGLDWLGKLRTEEAFATLFIILSVNLFRTQNTSMKSWSAHFRTEEPQFRGFSLPETPATSCSAHFRTFQENEMGTHFSDPQC